MPKCKNCVVEVQDDVVLEESGYCFTCAEELACLLKAEGMPTWSAWYKEKPAGEIVVL